MGQDPPREGRTSLHGFRKETLLTQSPETNVHVDDTEIHTPSEQPIQRICPRTRRTVTVEIPNPPVINVIMKVLQLTSTITMCR